MIDTSDDMTVELRRGHQRARKQHRCVECRRTIDAGETYLVTVYPWEGEIETDRCCAHCEIARRWLSAECSGYVYGCVLLDLDEHVAEGLYPQSLADFAASMRAQWRVDGDLMPVPEMPPTSGQLLEHSR
jgi:hypothetical protein